jgi:hypothetical protein
MRRVAKRQNQFCLSGFDKLLRKDRRARLAHGEESRSS